MSQYYIDTPGGPRGPYSREQVIEGIKAGKIPTSTMLRDATTGHSIRAVSLSGDMPSDSGSYNPAQASPQQQGPYQHPQSPQGGYGQGNAQGNHYQQGGAQGYPGQYQQQGYPQQHPQQYQQPYGGQSQHQYYRSRPTSGYAIASLVLSLITLAVCIPTWILGIIFGVMALKETEPDGPKSGRGLAQAGIWTGAGIGLIYVLFIALIIFAETYN